MANKNLASEKYVDEAIKAMIASKEFTPIDAQGAFMIPFRKSNAVQQYMRLSLSQIDNVWVPDLDQKVYEKNTQGEFVEVQPMIRKFVATTCILASLTAFALPFAPMQYVDQKCEETLGLSKAYTDEKVGDSCSTNDVKNIISESEDVVHAETDPNVPTWAKSPSKPEYSASEVGARPNDWMPSLEQLGIEDLARQSDLTNKVDSTNAYTKAETDEKLSAATNNLQTQVSAIAAATSGMVKYEVDDVYRRKVKIADGGEYQTSYVEIDSGFEAYPPKISLISDYGAGLIIDCNSNPEFGIEDLNDRIRRISPPYVPSAVDPTFSNAVLAVGLNIDTNSVAVLNEIAATFGDFPVAGTATTVGGLLAALAAAVAWLRKRTAHLESDGTADDTFAADIMGKQVAKDAIEDEKTRTVFDEFARMDDFTDDSTESDSFDVAITKLSQLLGENVAA